jgi:enoyl-CoA hydratase
VSEPVVLTEVTDRVALITLNRPDARNALSSEVLAALPEAIAACDADADVDVLVLTGADPAFCAGVDLKSLASGTTAPPSVPSSDPSRPDPARAATARREPFAPTRKPLVAAVNGAAVTGGLEVVLACDFVVASERARFADTHARVGIMPGWGLTVRLAEAVGQRRAREMSVTGNFVDARTAYDWGLVNHVVAHEELLPYCRALAADIVSNDQPGVRGILATYAAELALVHDAQLDLESGRSREWMAGGGGRADEIARRREGIVARGRAQQGNDEQGDRA